MLILLLLIIIILCSFKFFRTTKIKWHTLFNKGVNIEDGKWGNACYCGKQGSTKTSSCIEFILENVSDEYPLYANMKTIKGIEYTYFSGLQGFYDVLNSGASNCVILYDEIFTLFPKSAKIPVDFMSFLSQLRKRKIYFITTAQEWLLINPDLRKYCRYWIKCKKKTIPFLKSFSFKEIYNGEEIKWSQEDNDYVSPLICNTVSKLNHKVLSRYDTNEVISHEYTKPTKIYNPL